MALMVSAWVANGDGLSDRFAFFDGERFFKNGQVFDHGVQHFALIFDAEQKYFFHNQAGIFTVKTVIPGRLSNSMVP